MSSKRPIFAIILGMLLLCVFPIMEAEKADAKDGSFGGGSGTKGDPYIIEDVWDLQKMSRDLEE